MSTRRFLTALVLAVTLGGSVLPAQAAPRGDAPCRRGECPEVSLGRGTITASYAGQTPGSGWFASNQAPVAHPYTYALTPPCIADDRDTGTCRPSDFVDCPAPPERVVEDLILERRRLVLPDGTTEDDFDPGGAAPGTEVGPWMRLVRACIDVTALNPAPSPGEVFRYFQQLPLPQLATKQQPPGDGLVGLPVIFYTDDPITQTFTLDIRGFSVTIVAGATSFTWHTGDGTELTSTDPGAPYPNQTVTHDYASGTYTASVTTTWGATFSVDDGASVAVPGTTTTDGPPVTFDVLQARSVLTNPYD